MKKILIGSCGGLTGYYLAKVFNDKSKYEIFGFDSNPALAPAQIMGFNNIYEICPASCESEFIDRLIALINGLEIDFYLPVHSKETLLVAKHEAEIRAKTKAGFIVSPWETYEKLDDKFSANKELKAAGINVPKLYDKLSQITYPVFAKPRRGSGSHKTFIVEDELDYNYLKNKYPDVGYFEYINGSEYTADVFFDNDYKLIAYNQRLRVKTLGGAAIVTRNSYEQYDCYNDLIKIQNTFLLRGPVNFQFIVKDGKAYFTDVNLRYASGGLPLTVASGVNLEKVLVSLCQGKAVDKDCCIVNRTQMTMYRVFNELFTL